MQNISIQEKIIRHGAYGVVLENAKILLSQKKRGPYQGLWDLPGGKIEFGETPEETVIRELSEETSLIAARLEFFTIVTATGEFYENNQPYGFHQVGLIYRILHWNEQPDNVAEEETRWIPLDNIVFQELTPFAVQIVSMLSKNHSWRPTNNIRSKVIGLAKRNNLLLVCEVLDDHGMLKGWCPMGGGIEFGEKAEDALKREIQEELRCDATIIGNPIIYENIFDHHDAIGHEIIFAFPICLENKEIYTKTRFQIHENRGSTHWVEWKPIEEFQQGKAKLFPTKLIDQL